MLHAGRAQENLARQAMIDSLTGLANRRAWDEELARRIAAADASGACLTLAIFDLDCFKEVNDRHGHDAGDAALRSASKALRQQLRERDFLARIGGDEFGLLISGVDPAAAMRIVDRVRGALSNIESEDCPQPVASAGVAVRTATAQHTAQRLFQLADQALLEAKRSGRARTVAAGS
jgi:diguanylate cyclase (GGDEF)-like protein